jgi:hypothetical protein
MTIRRDWLKRQVEAGLMECRCDHHLTDDYRNDLADNFGETDWKLARIRKPKFEPRMMPGGFERDVCVEDDFVTGSMNLMDHHFTGNCGNVSANSKAGPFTLHVHSNLCYTLRFKQAKEVAAC